MGYLLISVIDREILTEQFQDYAHARKVLIQEMRTACPDIPLETFLQKEYEGEDFGFDCDRAYVNNGKGGRHYDWAIIRCENMPSQCTKKPPKQFRVEIVSREGFYLGNIKHVLDSRFQYLWSEQCGCTEGLFTDPESGLSFALVSVNYGTGCFVGIDGNNIPLENGVAGIVPLELATKKDGLTEGLVVAPASTAVITSWSGQHNVKNPNGRFSYMNTCWIIH